MDSQNNAQHQHSGMGEDNSMPAGYYYPSDDPPYGMGYAGQMQQYPPVPGHAPQTRGLDMHHQGMPPYQNLTLLPSHFQQNVYSGSPPHGPLPLSTGSPAPGSPDINMYAGGPLSPPVSGSETSGDGLYHHSNSSGANSPSSSRANSLVHRTARYHPTPSPTSSAGRRRRTHDSDDDDDNMGMPYIENLAHTRKEATRRQRIEAEQRRRDELRDGYAKLKDVLPVSNQKSSKVSLLERATNHIISLDKANKDLQARINALEAEMQRLRAVNEKISLSQNNTPSPGRMGEGVRSLTPAHEGGVAGHSLTSVRGQLPPSEHSSPSASENGL